MRRVEAVKVDEFYKLELTIQGNGHCKSRFKDENYFSVSLILILHPSFCLCKTATVPMVTLHTVKVPCPTTLPPMARSMTNGGHP